MDPLPFRGVGREGSRYHRMVVMRLSFRFDEVTTPSLVYVNKSYLSRTFS